MNIFASRSPDTSPDGEVRDETSDDEHGLVELATASESTQGGPIAGVPEAGPGYRSSIRGGI